MKISVCLATYNGEKYIKEQLNSILKQLTEIDEIVISDDNSSDNTLHIINSLNDSKIRTVINSGKKGATYNFENSLKFATGDIIIFADQDDIWEDDRIHKIIPYFTKYDLVVNDCIIVDSLNNIIQLSYFDYNNSQNGFFRNIYKCSYLGCCMAFKKELLKYSLPFPPNLIAHDIWIGLIAEIYGKVIFTGEKLVRYRRHGLNLSFAFEKSRNSFFFKLKYRFILLYLIIRQIIIKYCSK